MDDRIRDFVEGEPLRALVYGGVIVAWLAAKVAQWLGYQGLQSVNLEATLVSAGAVIATITEVARRFVYSPATVAAIVEDLAPASVEDANAPAGEIAADAAKHAEDPPGNG